MTYTNQQKSIEYENGSNNFQKQLKKDITEIKSSDSVYVPADKTKNVYKMPKDMYKKLLRDTM